MVMKSVVSDENLNSRDESGTLYCALEVQPTFCALEVQPTFCALEVQPTFCALEVMVP